MYTDNPETIYQHLLGWNGIMLILAATTLILSIWNESPFFIYGSLWWGFSKLCDVGYYYNECEELKKARSK